MAHDIELESLIRGHVDGLPWLSEKRMFGGLVWMMEGNMLCAAIKAGLMARVGKAAEPAALAMPDVRPMGAGSRRMGGWVVAGEDAWRDQVIRTDLLSAAIAHVFTLPPRTANARAEQ